MKKKMKWKKRRDPVVPTPLAKPPDRPPVCPACEAGRHDQCSLMAGLRCGCVHGFHREYPDPIEVGLHLEKHGNVKVPPIPVEFIPPEDPQAEFKFPSPKGETPPVPLLAKPRIGARLFPGLRERLVARRKAQGGG